ncbi:MAG TPA: RHS repeat-associated core domain-containing protein, partial [Phototrophicaceae bacterium]|nr:RHS repeat-associated core domain-containing protein [Phototrophicaceae bacterium]
YDAVGNLLSRDAGVFGKYEYRYDSLYRLISVTKDGEKIDLAYNLNGWLTTITRANGLVTTYDYDANGRIRSVQHMNQAGERLDRFSYIYDAVGNITRITRGDAWDVLYSYDIAHQVISERWLNPINLTTYGVTYAYDNSGNRVEQVLQLAQTNPNRTLFTYNHKNQLVSEFRNVEFVPDQRLALLVGVVLLGSGVRLRRYWWRQRRLLGLLTVFPLLLGLTQQPTADVSYQYDNSGNLVTMHYQDGDQLTYTYDASDRLTSVQGTNDNGDVVNTTITYNPLGRIQEITSREETYRFVYDAYELLGIENVTAGTRDIFFLLSPNRILRIDSANDSRWLLHDALGSVRKWADRDGNLINSDQVGLNLNAFGQFITPYGPETTYSLTNTPQMMFSGQLYEGGSDLYLMGVRAYTATYGRFIQRDPLRHDPQSTLYTYAYNRPGVYSDPDGLMPVSAYQAASSIVPVQPELFKTATFDVRAQIPTPPPVQALQAEENARVLKLARFLNGGVNSKVMGLSSSWCDFYIQRIRPDEQAAPIEPLAFNPSNLWRIANSSDPQNKVAPFAQLEKARTQLPGVSPYPLAGEGCFDSLPLPALFTETYLPENITQYDTLENQLAEVPLYPALPEQMTRLTALPLAPAAVPTRIDPQSTLGQPPLDELAQLRAQMQQFYENTLLIDKQLTPFWVNSFDRAFEVLTPTEGH